MLKFKLMYAIGWG